MTVELAHHRNKQIFRFITSNPATFVGRHQPRTQARCRCASLHRGGYWQGMAGECVLNTSPVSPVLSSPVLSSPRLPRPSPNLRPNESATGYPSLSLSGFSIENQSIYRNYRYRYSQRVQHETSFFPISIFTFFFYISSKTSAFHRSSQSS